MAFLVLAFPNLESNDYYLIQKYREKNDKLFYTVVEPHFTIVFPVFDLTKEEFKNHICEKLNGTKKINFTIRCSTINKDSFNEYYPPAGASVSLVNTSLSHNKIMKNFTGTSETLALAYEYIIYMSF